MRATFLALVLACCAAQAAAQTMYKCVLQGKTVYQDAPCPEAAKQDMLQAPAPGPAKAAAGKDAPAAKETPASELEPVIEVMAGYRACADGIAEWEGAHRSAYEAWRLRNGGLVSRAENDVEARGKYSKTLEAVRNGPTSTCAKVLAVIKPGDTEFMKGVRKELNVRKSNP